MFTKIIKITTAAVAFGGMMVAALNTCPQITPFDKNAAVLAEIEASDTKIVEEVKQTTDSIENIAEDLIAKKEAEDAKKEKEKDKMTDEERKRIENYEKNPYEITNTYDSKYVRNDTVVYNGAGLGFDRLGMVSKGSLVLVTGTTDNGWCRIQSEYGISYIPAAQLAVTKPKEKETEQKQTGAIMSYLPPSVQTTHTASPIYEATVIDWINDARKATGLNELMKDESLLPGLKKVVEQKSQDKYMTFTEEMNGGCLITTAINHSDVYGFIEALMEDESIRDDLLSAEYTRIQYYALPGDPGYIGIIVVP